MKSKISYRLIIFAFSIVFGVAYSIPTLFNTSGSKVNLGLDLQGGMHMLLGVNTEEAVAAKIKAIASGINYHCEGHDILIDELSFDEEQVTFELLDKDEMLNLDTHLKEYDGLNIIKDNLNFVLNLTEEEIVLTKEFALKQTIETIRNRLDLFGLAEPTVAKQGTDKVLVELPGIKTAEDEQRARKLIGQTAHLEMMSVDENRQKRADVMTHDEARSFGDVLLEDKYIPQRKFAIKAIPILDGSMLTDARVAFDQNNQPVINFSLDGQGAQIFGDWTGKNVGIRLAVVLDRKVYSAPVIRERIGGGHGQISGSFTVDEAHDLAIALRSGALSASVKMLEKRSVGPSLGADSIKASAFALIAGFILVAIFMVFYYGISGVVSDIALIVNLLIILAAMSLFGATLTLPGMVGIVLTVGMAVDANVIINERIKEVLYQGKSMMTSIEEGYKNAFSAIIDANITTLIAAVALYAYGTGPIKGFAITLSIGILASMLTAILGTHGLYEFLANKIAKSTNQRLWFGMKEQK
jgi:preprotein translocase subunit SecD